MDVKTCMFKDCEPALSGQLDGKGKVIPITDETVATIQNPCWLHLNIDNIKTAQWIAETPLIPDIVKSQLHNEIYLSKEVRLDDNIFLVLRGVNISPEGIIASSTALQVYITNRLIISVFQGDAIDPIIDVYQDLQKGIGAVDVASWLGNVAESIKDIAVYTIRYLTDQLMVLEESISDGNRPEHRDICQIRQKLTILKNGLYSKRDILSRISTERVSWIDDRDRQRLHDISSQLERYGNEIDSAIGRINSVVGQMHALIADALNRRIYVMTLLTMIFLPITFLTSLFGVNLGGIPGSESRWGFFLLLGILIILSVLSYWVLRRRKWM